MSQASFLTKLFSAPKFLEMSAVSIEITAGGIYYLSLKRSLSGWVPDYYGVIPLAPGEVVHSDIVNREAVVKALQLIRRKTNLRFVRYSIPEEKSYIFKTQLPSLKPDEIHSVLDFKLEENIPLSSKEAVFDYEILPDKSGSSQLNVMVSAVSQKYVEEMGNLFNDAGFVSSVFSPESKNLAKSLVAIKNEQVIVLANIRESSIVLSLVVSGFVYQTSTINFGSKTLSELLAKYYNVPLLEAVKIKKEKLYDDCEDNLGAFSYLINTLSAIKDEIYKFIQYSNEREDVRNKVDRVILSGSDALIYNLTNYLSANLCLPVEVADIWVNNHEDKSYVPDINRSESLDFAVVNGLSLM